MSLQLYLQRLHPRRDLQQDRQLLRHPTAAAVLPLPQLLRKTRNLLTWSARLTPWLSHFLAPPLQPLLLLQLWRRWNSVALLRQRSLQLVLLLLWELLNQPQRSLKVLLQVLRLSVAGSGPAAAVPAACLG